MNRPIKLLERPFEREHLHVLFSGNLEIAEKADMAVQDERLVAIPLNKDNFTSHVTSL